MCTAVHNTVDRDALQCALSSRHMHAHTCKKLASCSHLEVLLTSVSSESESESHFTAFCS